MMIQKAACFVLLLSIFSVVFAHSEPVQRTREDIFIAPLAETVLYGRDMLAFGGGFAVGYGSGTSIGLRFLYTFDTEDVQMLEMAVFLRFYFFGMQASSGPFAQVIGGAAIFDRHRAVSLPAEVGTLSIGLCAGWRFMLGNRFFIEPAVRGGFPYIIGGGLSAGVRF